MATFQLDGGARKRPRTDYDGETYNEAKRLVVVEGMNPREASAELGGKPSASTIWRWSTTHLDADGKTWEDLQRAERDEQYRANAPARIAEDVRELIEELRKAEVDPVKKADSLAKLTSSLTKLTRPEHQLPAMYHVLEELVKFTRRHYPDLFSKALLEMVRDFKNVLRQRVESR
jgi:hypothetical protein